MRILKRLVVTISLLSPMGCSTIISYNQFGPHIYGGVRLDALQSYEKPELLILCLPDFPFSLLFDTLLLPMTVAQAGDAAPEIRPLFTRKKPVGIVEGVIVQDEEAGYQVFPLKEWPPAQVRPLALARVKVFGDPKGPELPVGGTILTDIKGHYLLMGEWDIPWKVIRVELKGFEPVEIPVSKLHSPTDQSYWGDHRLLVRMKAR